MTAIFLNLRFWEQTYHKPIAIDTIYIYIYESLCLYVTIIILLEKPRQYHVWAYAVGCTFLIARRIKVVEADSDDDEPAPKVPWKRCHLCSTNSSGLKSSHKILTVELAEILFLHLFGGSNFCKCILQIPKLGPKAIDRL